MVLVFIYLERKIDELHIPKKGLLKMFVKNHFFFETGIFCHYSCQQISFDVWMKETSYHIYQEQNFSSLYNISRETWNK